MMGVHNPLTVVNTMPAVTIKTLPAVTVASLPTVTIANWKTVQVVEQKSPTVNGLADLTLTDEAQTITANPARKGLILQAPDTNQTDILIQGFLRIAAGAVVEFPAANAVTVSGTRGDVLHVGERL